MNQTITAPNAPAIMVSNTCALSDADRTLLIQMSLCDKIEHPEKSTI